MAGAHIYSCSFLLALDQVVLISVYQPGFFPGLLLLLSKTQPQLRKAGLDRDVILCLSGPGLKAKGSLISLIVTGYCLLYSLKRAAFVS